MSRRRLRRKSEKERRHAPVPAGTARAIVRQAGFVERLAYTRSQAAEALGIGRSTFIRRVLPLVETIEMPWGAKLIPVDELERLVGERRRAVAAERRSPSPRGRKSAISGDVVARIRSERASGKSFGEIARQLNAEGVQTAQGGRAWWPSTVRPFSSVRVRPSSLTRCRDGDAS